MHDSFHETHGGLQDDSVCNSCARFHGRYAGTVSTSGGLPLKIERQGEEQYIRGRSPITLTDKTDYDGKLRTTENDDFFVNLPTSGVNMNDTLSYRKYII